MEEESVVAIMVELLDMRWNREGRDSDELIAKSLLWSRASNKKFIQFN